MLKISISGVRGIVPESLTPEVIFDFARAFGSYLNGGAVVIGADTRPSKEEIKKTLVKGLLKTGCSIIDLGIATTPTVGILTKHLKAAGGIVITASHNPNPWNGLKFIAPDGIFLLPEEFEKLVKIYRKKKITEKPPGKLSFFNTANQTHIHKILRVIDKNKIKARRFKVVIDSCNGAGSIITPQLLEELGCQVIEINTDINKPFPHGPEPTPENLKDLCNKVSETAADIGFAQDPDADRLSLVTNSGRALSEEYTLGLAVKYVLSKIRAQNKITVANLSTSSLIDDIAKNAKAKVIRTKIGEVYVASRIKKSKAQIGGEGNGGVIYPAVGYNRDSLTAIALILSCLAETDQSLDQIISRLPVYFLAKEKISCRSAFEAQKILKRAEKIFKKEKTDKTEGLKIIQKQGWTHLRPSNTEPILRIFSEAGSALTAEKLNREIRSKLKI